jgi:hypothetical protein
MVEESLWAAQSRNARWLKPVFEIIREMEAAGIPYGIQGKWMELERIINERSLLANSGGLTPLSAKEQLTQLRRSDTGLGAKKVGLLNWGVQRLHDKFFEEIVEPAVAAGIINSKTYQKTIKPNRRWYVPFAVLKHLEATMPATVMHQLGTLDPIGNPLTAFLMKAVAMQNMIAREQAIGTVIDMLTEHFPGDIEDAKVTRYEIPKSQRHPDAYPFREIPVKHPDWGILTKFVDGRPKHYYVDPLIAAGFNTSSAAEVEGATQKFSMIFRDYFYPLYITFNASFHFVNLIRDIGRTRRTLRISRYQAVKNYSDALGAAIARLKGEDHPLIAEMMDNMAIGPLQSKHLQHMDPEDATAQILAQYGLMEPEPLTHAEKFAKWKLISWLPYMGDLFESLPKIATYKYLREYNRKTPRDAAFTVRNYSGTPHTMRKGVWISTAKALMPFFNVYKEGFKADYEMATGTYGHVRTRPYEKGPTGADKKAKKEGWDRASTAAGWWWNYVQAHGAYAFIQGLASSGALGDDPEEWFGGASEYDLTNYAIIPAGHINEGEFGKKLFMIRVPRDPTAQLISGIVYKMGRMFGGDRDKLLEALGQTAESRPALSPVVNIPAKWAEYVIGGSPEDSFRDRPILSRDAAMVRGQEGLKEMITWSWNQMGAGKDMFEIFTSGEGDEGVASRLTALPVARRFFKITDQGYREDLWSRMNERDRAKAVHKLKHHDNVKDALKKYWVLERYRQLHSKEGTSFTPEQELMHLDLKAWYRSTYTPLDGEIQTQEVIGDKKGANSMRKDLSDLTKDLLGED